MSTAARCSRERAVQAIEQSGFKVAGFSINADSGATLGATAIAKRLKQVKSGDIIIAHMNKPDSDSAEGLSLGLLQLKAKGFRFVRLDETQLVSAR